MSTATRAATWLDLPRPWLCLAPMAGVADWAFREVCYELGAELAVSPLLSATGLLARPARLLPAIGARHGARPFIAQLFGKHPEEFRRAARLLGDALPLAGIDINMGCPAVQVVNSNHGAALLKHPELAAEIVAATCAGTRLPVSVKLRIGWDSVTAPDLAPRLEAAGAAALTVHGRTREQQYGGVADLAAIAAVKRAVSIPVIGNGDVVSLASARRMLDRTGVDGVMAGRGVVGNPWLFAELQAALKGDARYLGAPGSRGEVIRRFARLAFEDEGPRAALTIRKHLVAYSRHSPYSAQLRQRLQALDSLADVEAWIDALESARATPSASG